MVWLLGCPWTSGNCLGMLVMLRYVYIHIYDGLLCMCDIILAWNDGYCGSSACDTNE